MTSLRQMGLRFTRLAIVLSVMLGSTLAALQPLHAQNLRSVESGRRLAIDWCSGCHVVEPASDARGWLADFAAIANVPSTTAVSLKVFLQTSHKNMPNFILQPEEADNIVAYILSLKRK